jgi:D-tyrosyl-tRNA(Tyr) deacylase
VRALVQRVTKASVSIAGMIHGQIDKGVLVFLGVHKNDTDDDAAYLAQRCADLRIFGDDNGKMNLSVTDVGGKVLVVSQFTLNADTRKGNRPSFAESAGPEEGERLYELFVGHLRARLGANAVATGRFRAMMDVELVNDGPVTVMLESKSRT